MSWEANWKHKCVAMSTIRLLSSLIWSVFTSAMDMAVELWRGYKGAWPTKLNKPSAQWPVTEYFSQCKTAACCFPWSMFTSDYIVCMGCQLLSWICLAAVRSSPNIFGSFSCPRARGQSNTCNLASVYSTGTWSQKRMLCGSIYSRSEYSIVACL